MRLQSVALPTCVAALVFLAGCASPTNRVPLTPEVAGKLQSAHTRVVANQREVTAEITGSNVAGAAIGATSAVPGGFLVGALIGAIASGTDSVIENRQAKKAEELVTPIRDRLVEADTPKALAEAIRAQLAGLPGFDPANLVLDRDSQVKKETVKSWVEAAPGKNLLLVQANYSFSADFSTLTLGLSAAVLTADPTLSASGTSKSYKLPSLYENYLACRMRLKSPGLMADNAAKWAHPDTDVRARFDEGVAELARLLAYDLRQGAVVVDKKNAQYTVPVRGLGNAFVANGRGLPNAMAAYERSEGSRRWVRALTGELFSLD